VIFDQNGHIIDSRLSKIVQPEDFLVSTPRDPAQPSDGDGPKDDGSRWQSTARRDESASRLQDIAKQLAELAQKERQPAVPRLAAAAPGVNRVEDESALDRVLERLDDNERQTVEAFSAVNERLTVLGRQIATLPQAQGFERPEDVPGYSALESAIRNVVEHIEVSEKRTRESLKAMQDRLGELAEQSAAQPRADFAQRTAPVLANLDARLTELANRLLRTESALQANMPDQVRREIALLAERIDSVKGAADQIAKQSQSTAAGVARSELREVETRLLATLRETQATASAPGAAGSDISHIKGEIGGLSRRMEEIRSTSASERDLQALRLSFEHLSTRVAQGPDVKPLAEMDRRLGELGRRLEQVSAAMGNAASISDMDARLVELGRRVDQALVAPPGAGGLEGLEQNIAAVSERISRTENQLAHIATMEQAIRQLYEGLEQSRARASQTVEEAASRTVDRMLLASRQQAARSPELKALEEGLRAVRDSSIGADRRNQETLAAVHETLSQIVEKIAELEGNSRGPGTAPTRPLHVFVPEPPVQQPARRDEGRAAVPGRADHPAADAPGEGGEPLSTGDDFIAAARRAAQAASARPMTLKSESGPAVTRTEDENNSLLGRFRKTEKFDAGPTSVDALRRFANDSRKTMRRRLIVTGTVLLVAVSAFALSMLSRSSAPPQGRAIEAPDGAIPGVESPAPEPERQGLVDLPADPILTGALPSSGDGNAVALPPPETGTQALRTAAANGNAVAQFIVASRYLEGEGVVPDPASAAFWYGQAAASGLAPAQYRLATLYERGKGVAQDSGAALAWYERAAAQGNIKSMHNAAVISIGGDLGPADYGRALTLFTAAAERGLADSQFNLAILYERGLGTTVDNAEAVFWYRLAGNQGDAQAGERAAKLEKLLSPKVLSQLEKSFAAWSPQPVDDSANVVKNVDPAWKDPDMTVSLSGAAVPLASRPASQDLVAEAQQLLLELGFNAGTPDGRLSIQTVAALREFQAQSGLEVTGEVTLELLEAMRAVSG
jgi:localization factor PodJL